MAGGTKAKDAPGRREARRFDYGLDFGAIDFRERPEVYRIGVGEQGVLLVEPYKSEILPVWRFRTPEEARAAAAAITDLFREYRRRGDFVGMDMARKFLQMGWTRARRYANHRSGRKWSAGRAAVLPPQPDPVKAESARIFSEAYHAAKCDPEYRRRREEHLALVEAHLRRGERDGGTAEGGR